MTKYNIMYFETNKIPIELNHQCKTENGISSGEIFTIKKIIGDFEQLLIINQYRQEITINPNQILEMDNEPF